MAFHALTSNWRRHEKDMGLPGVVKRLAEVSSIVSIRGVNQVLVKMTANHVRLEGERGYIPWIFGIFY